MLLPTLFKKQRSEILNHLLRMLVLLDAPSLSRLLQQLAKLGSLVSVRLKWVTGELRALSPNVLALGAFRCILILGALDTTNIGDWLGDADTVVALCQFTNLRVLDIA
ncbi:hypothetical protein JCM3774_003066 [Rhodotorula dairenensis]